MKMFRQHLSVQLNNGFTIISLFLLTPNDRLLLATVLRAESDWSEKPLSTSWGYQRPKMQEKDKESFRTVVVNIAKDSNSFNIVFEKIQIKKVRNDVLKKNYTEDDQGNSFNLQLKKKKKCCEI